MAENQKQFTLLPKILNGGIAGIVGVACTFPLDLVKTRLQKQSVGKDGKMMYSGIPDAFKKIFASEGLRGMYRGSGVLILLVTPEKAVKLAANDFFRYHFKDAQNNLTVFRQTVAAALAGVAHVFVTTPMELLKIQLQDAGRIAAMDAKIDPKTGRAIIPKISATKITMDIIRQRGVTGLFKGIVACWARDVPFCMIYFPLFAALDRYGPRKPDGSGDAKFYWSFISGMGAGGTAAFLMTPCDVIKTRIQSLSKAKADKSYASVWGAFKDILQNEGIRAFFKGGACRLIVIAPLYAIIQGVYFLGVAEKLLGIEKDVKHVKK
ncbi:mitochondrial glutamate carrier 1-like [Anthonomus grandis grandis]|uniref:mitochondrial glutamate carrier 1-like n=1 Tax=Anthonomus grandis grandis TaxID=2921223 RepID=UPI00216600FC|nr:mitochondrial glutamate carrier 1-like [Anthonomus grandis grandis]